MPVTSSHPEPVCLLIADISGYTTYLVGVELDHAQDILADLLGTMVNALRPRFALSSVEGDAAFMFSPTESIDGTVLLDTVEGAYFAFRRRLASIGRASSCQCNACVLIPTLDLKFGVHHGAVIRHEVAGREELLGADVIVVHRIMKNTVREAHDLSAYAFISDACIAVTTLDPEALGMKPHSEEYDVGVVSGWVHDLARAWDSDQQSHRVWVGPDDALWLTSEFVGLAPARVFELMTSPQLRPRWSPEPIVVEEDSPNSRRGIGTTNHCIHGDTVILEELVDWQPPRYWTAETGLPGGTPFLMTDEVEEVDGGSMVHTRVRARRPEEEPALVEILTTLKEMVLAAQAGLQSYATAVEPIGAGPEPGVPTPDEEKRLATAVRSSGG